MTFPPYIFKSKAVRALKGNWQTALLISFCASLPMTVVQLLQQTKLPMLTYDMSPERIVAAVMAIQPSVYWMLSLAGTIALILTPMLAVGCNHYFVRRLHKEELGMRGLFSRAKIFGRALWLYVMMYVRILLWSLLLFVPGVMAALRYSMAPYYLAENPDMTASEALAKSKETMADKKLSYFMLELSFIGWLLLAMIAETFLYELSVIVALVASQFIQLYMATYMNAACAAFFEAARVPNGLEKAANEANSWVRSMQQGERPADDSLDLPEDDAEDAADSADEPDDRTEDDKSDEEGSDEE